MYIFTIQPDSSFVQSRFDKEDNWTKPVKLKIYSTAEFASLTDAQKIAHFSDESEEDSDDPDPMWIIAAGDIRGDIGFEHGLFSDLYPEKYDQLEEEAQEQEEEDPRWALVDALDNEILNVASTDKWALAWINNFYEIYGLELERIAFDDPNLIVTHDTKQ